MKNTLRRLVKARVPLKSSRFGQRVKNILHGEDFTLRLLTWDVKLKVK
jgi:hypothetical protein